MEISKKGAELSLNFIIIAAIGLVVLVIALVFFTGGAERLLRGVPESVQVNQQQLNLWRNECELYCNQGSKSGFCNTFKSLDKNKNGKQDAEDVFYVCNSNTRVKDLITNSNDPNAASANIVELGVDCGKVSCS